MIRLLSASLFSLACMLLIEPPLTASPPNDVIAYVFPQDRTLQPNEIAAEKLTRINYAFANIQNGKILQGFSHDRENFQTLNALKRRNPKLQILISVGGWTWSGGFSDMALTKQSRKVFVDSAIDFLETNNLDGIDVDWEYPGLPGVGNTHRSKDKQNYTALLEDLRKALNREEKKLNRSLIASVATGASSDFLAHTEMSKLQGFVDSVNLMSYDYYESEDDHTTGNHAPLYTNAADPKQVSVDASVQAYLNAGVPADKIVLGVPFYGHAWSDVADSGHGLFQPGKKTKLNADYNQIVNTHLKNGFTRYWDSTASAPYLYNPANQTFITYDDPESIALKCQYVLTHKLAGIMFWEYSGDADGALLTAIDRGLRP